MIGWLMRFLTGSLFCLTASWATPNMRQCEDAPELLAGCASILRAGFEAVMRA